MLLVGRFIIGIGVGIANVVCPTYIAETSLLPDNLGVITFSNKGKVYLLREPF
jgi:hypothetical protein